MELAQVVSNMLVLDSLGRPRDALDRGRGFTPPSEGPVSETNMKKGGRIFAVVFFFDDFSAILSK